MKKPKVSNQLLGIALEVACEDGRKKVWKAVLKKPGMSLYMLTHAKEIGILLEEYNFPEPLVSKLTDVSEEHLSNYLL